MNNLDEIINKYKLEYNKDKSYLKFNFQFEYTVRGKSVPMFLFSRNFC